VVTYIDLLQAKFKYNGRGEDNCFDCYGLCMEVSRRLGKELPNITTPDGMINMQNRIRLEAERQTEWFPVPPSDGTWGTIEGVTHTGSTQLFGIKEGAIAYFRVKGLLAHVGIVIAPDRFIHAWEKSGGVCVERLSLWRSRLVGIYEHKYYSGKAD